MCIQVQTCMRDNPGNVLVLSVNLLSLNSDWTQCLEFMSIMSMMHFNYFMIKQARRNKVWHWHPSWRMSQYRHGDISVVGRNGCYCYGSSLMQTKLQQFPVKKGFVDSITIVKASFTWTFHIHFFLACPPVFLCLKRWIWNQTDTAVHAEDKCVFLIMWMRVNTF